MTQPASDTIFLGDALPHSPRILVADDDWLNRDLLETYLTNAGCQVEVYSDGQSAWEAMLKDPPDLAMLDIRMPHIDGISLCRQIKQSKRMGYLPVIVVTALDAEDEKLRAIEAGADDFIGKPYSSVILLTRVRSLLRNKSLHQELEGRNRLLRQVLNSYVDSDLADVILTDPEKHLKLGGETRNVTVLFADLRGFTSFSETFPADRVVETLNTVFEELTEVIFTHRGTFDKYLGDAIMAFWGAPFSQEDDIERALQAALEMQSRFDEMRQKVDMLKKLMGMGVGVHTGEVIVGNIGSERVMDYTVIGDTVNIAKRLQEIARPGEVLVTEEICKLVPQAKVQAMTAQQLPGRQGMVPIFGLQSFGKKKK